MGSDQIFNPKTFTSFSEEPFPWEPFPPSPHQVPQLNSGGFLARTHNQNWRNTLKSTFTYLCQNWIKFWTAPSILNINFQDMQKKTKFRQTSRFPKPAYRAPVPEGNPQSWVSVTDILISPAQETSEVWILPKAEQSTSCCAISSFISVSCLLVTSHSIYPTLKHCIIPNPCKPAPLSRAHHFSKRATLFIRLPKPFHSPCPSPKFLKSI